MEESWSSSVVLRSGVLLGFDRQLPFIATFAKGAAHAPKRSLNMYNGVFLGTRVGVRVCVFLRACVCVCAREGVHVCLCVCVKVCVCVS